MTGEQENRILAEFVGITNVKPCTCAANPLIGTLPNGLVKHIDFRGNEELNAMLLEKMPVVVLRHEGDYWVCYQNLAGGIEIEHPDRKTAIVEAALKLIAAKEQK